jgi:hypothetical protein
MKKSRMVMVMVLLMAICALMGARGPLIARDAVLVIDLGGKIPESVPWNPIMSLFMPPEPTVLDKLMLLKDAARDGRVKAVVARIGGFDEAVAVTKRLLGVPANKDVDLVYGHEPVTFWKIITGHISESIEAVVLTPPERDLIHALRAQGIWDPGTPLAVMPDPVKVR